MSLNISICFILSSDVRWFYDFLLILFTWQVIETDTGLRKGEFIGKILEYLAEPSNELSNQGLRKGNREALRSWQQGDSNICCVSLQILSPKLHIPGTKSDGPV